MEKYSISMLVYALWYYIWINKYLYLFFQLVEKLYHTRQLSWRSWYTKQNIFSRRMSTMDIRVWGSHFFSYVVEYAVSYKYIILWTSTYLCQIVKYIYDPKIKKLPEWTHCVGYNWEGTWPSQPPNARAGAAQQPSSNPPHWNHLPLRAPVLFIVRSSLISVAPGPVLLGDLDRLSSDSVSRMVSPQEEDIIWCWCVPALRVHLWKFTNSCSSSKCSAFL